jgi:hypothetical protein
VAGRLAARLDTGLLIDAVDVDSSGVVTQVVFGGSYTVRSQVTISGAVSSSPPRGRSSPWRATPWWATCYSWTPNRPGKWSPAGNPLVTLALRAQDP